MSKREYTAADRITEKFDKSAKCSISTSASSPWRARDQTTKRVDTNSRDGPNRPPLSRASVDRCRCCRSVMSCIFHVHTCLSRRLTRHTNQRISHTCPFVKQNPLQSPTETQINSYPGLHLCQFLSQTNHEIPVVTDHRPCRSAPARHRAES
jgi:hypothetical protein